MMDNLSHFEFLTVAGALVMGWIKFQADYNKLSSRVHALHLSVKTVKQKHGASPVK